MREREVIFSSVKLAGKVNKLIFCKADLCFADPFRWLNKAVRFPTKPFSWLRGANIEDPCSLDTRDLTLDPQDVTVNPRNGSKPVDQ